jgi:hypothetical protein
MLANTQADAFIDDFEEAMISPGWSSFNDVMPAHDVFKITQVLGGAVGTAHSGQFTGTGALTSAMGGFGAGTVYNAAIDPVHGIYCVDITAFDGVSFWAKAGPGAMSATPSISLNFILPTTNAVSMNGDGMMNGGDCTVNCYNHPRVTFTLSTTWTQYTAPFASASGGSATVQGVIQELGWLTPDSNWDFSIDEIAYYKGTPPTGPVGM